MTQQTLRRKHTSVSFFNYDLKQMVETRDWKKVHAAVRSSAVTWTLSKMEGDGLRLEEMNLWNSDQSVAGCEYGKYRLILFPQWKYYIWNISVAPKGEQAFGR